MPLLSDLVLKATRYFHLRKRKKNDCQNPPTLKKSSNSRGGSTDAIAVQTSASNRLIWQ